MGVAGPLLRDADRMRQSYERTNRSPLGACAFTTTRAPIDRNRLAGLLGFGGIVENGYDASRSRRLHAGDGIDPEDAVPGARQVGRRPAGLVPDRRAPGVGRG